MHLPCCCWLWNIFLMYKYYIMFIKYGCVFFVIVFFCCLLLMLEINSEDSCTPVRRWEMCGLVWHLFQDAVKGEDIFHEPTFPNNKKLLRDVPIEDTGVFDGVELFTCVYHFYTLSYIIYPWSTIYLSIHRRSFIYLFIDFQLCIYCFILMIFPCTTK